MQREFYIVALTQRQALEAVSRAEQFEFTEKHEDIESAKEQRKEDDLTTHKIYKILITAECVEENGTPVVKADLAQGGV